MDIDIKTDGSVNNCRGGTIVRNNTQLTVQSYDKLLTKDVIFRKSWHSKDIAHF